MNAEILNHGDYYKEGLKNMISWYGCPECHELIVFEEGKSTFTLAHYTSHPVVICGKCGCKFKAYFDHTDTGSSSSTITTKTVSYGQKYLQKKVINSIGNYRCPTCGKPAISLINRLMKRLNKGDKVHKTSRTVNITCKHCGSLLELKLLHGVL